MAITLSGELVPSTGKTAVDLQFRNAGGVHNLGLGGDRSGLSTYGVYWHSLTTTQIKVTRDSANPDADDVRVRIWVYQ